MYGFLEVSHVHRRSVKGTESDRDRLANLVDSTAVVHCRFCHKLYTICEFAKLYDTPMCQDQFAKLLVQAPAFVQHFEQSTQGYDWAAERAKLSASKSAACKGKKKRKRTEDDGEEEGEGENEERFSMCL